MFELGDVVRLKSGGPEMTVSGWEDLTFPTIECHWFIGDELVCEDFFADMLELADDEDGFYDADVVNLEAMDAYFAAPDPELTDEEFAEVDQLIEDEKLLQDALGR